MEGDMPCWQLSLLDVKLYLGEAYNVGFGRTLHAGLVDCVGLVSVRQICGDGHQPALRAEGFFNVAC